MWTRKEKAHVVHISADSLIWLSRALEEPNLAQSAFVTHGPFPPDVPETGRLGTSLKSEGLCVSSTALPPVSHPSHALSPRLQHAVHTPPRKKVSHLFLKGATRDEKESLVYWKFRSLHLLSGEQELKEVESSCLDLVSATSPHKTTCYG